MYTDISLYEEKIKGIQKDTSFYIGFLWRIFKDKTMDYFYNSVNNINNDKYLQKTTQLTHLTEQFTKNFDKYYENDDLLKPSTRNTINKKNRNPT